MKQQLFTFAIALTLVSVADAQTYVTFGGYAQNNTYTVTYFDAQGRDFSAQVDSVLHSIDTIFSVYDSGSVVSRINRNIPVALPPSFMRCFELSQAVSEQTAGAFDITVAPIVSVWGFGAAPRTDVSQKQIDSILSFVGYCSVFIKNNELHKKDARASLNFNAIAQGFSADEVAGFLSQKGITDYVVEIGGEVSARGGKPDGSPWYIGIETPQDNRSDTANSLSLTVGLTDAGLATSGNYRNFYIENGTKYSHTINPQTGYPARNSLLSATIIASTSALADAYATACMVMGLDTAITFLQKHTDLHACLMYADADGTVQIFYTPLFRTLIVGK